jgi:hypothetical protein
MSNVVEEYLDLLDSQRENAYALLNGLGAEQLWQRPAPGEWCLGEILDHNYLLIASTFPYVKLAWKLERKRAEKQRLRPYKTEIDDPYRKSTFPMWVGFMWTPRYTPRKRVPLEKLMAENRDLHAAVRRFYTGKDPALLGNAFVYDPLFGWINLIVTLRIGIYHDQLHFDDFPNLVEGLKPA